MFGPLQDCIICMEKLSTGSGYSDVTDSKTIGPAAVGCLTKCSHSFHLLCLLAMYRNGNKVPTCWPGVGTGGPIPSCCISACDRSCLVKDPGFVWRQLLHYNRMGVGRWGLEWQVIPGCPSFSGVWPKWREIRRTEKAESPGGPSGLAWPLSAVSLCILYQPGCQHQ